MTLNGLKKSFLVWKTPGFPRPFFEDFPNLSEKSLFRDKIDSNDIHETSTLFKELKKTYQTQHITQSHSHMREIDPKPLFLTSLEQIHIILEIRSKIVQCHNSFKERKMNIKAILKINVNHY